MQWEAHGPGVWKPRFTAKLYLMKPLNLSEIQCPGHLQNEVNLPHTALFYNVCEQFLTEVGN